MTFSLKSPLSSLIALVLSTTVSAECSISAKTVPTLSVKAMGTNIVGTFKKFKGTCKFDPNNIEDTVYRINLDTQSLDAGIKGPLIRSETFLDSDKYPVMTFNSTKNVKTGPNTMKMYGNLIIKNISKPIAWDVTIDPKSTPEEARFTAIVNIDRNNWGMTSMSGLADRNVLVKVNGVMSLK